jgi:hypothetical protein
MRASLPSFTDNIAAFRKSLIAGNPPHDKGYRIAVGILDRWELRPDADSMWDKIKSKLRYPEPAERFVAIAPGLFIAAIIKAGFVAYGVDKVVRELPDEEKKQVSNIKRLLNEGQHDQAHERLSLLSSVLEARKKLSQKKETAARTQFMVALHDYLMEQCGQPFHNEVATLTNIVFDLRPKDKDTPKEKIEVTGEQVRDAVRARPITNTPTPEPLPPTMAALSEVMDPSDGAHRDILPPK